MDANYRNDLPLYYLAGTGDFNTWSKTSLDRVNEWLLVHYENTLDKYCCYCGRILLKESNECLGCGAPVSINTIRAVTAL